MIERIHSAFAGVASSMGYSEMHGRVISALMLSDKPLSSEELSKETGYSPSAISLSLDLLELVGIVKKVKNTGDRRLYARLDGDLIEGLRGAFFFKLRKNITGILDEFAQYRAATEDEKMLATIGTLEKEVRRLDEYVKRLAAVEVPRQQQDRSSITPQDS